jgi:hypothetical protein
MARQDARERWTLAPTLEEIYFNKEYRVGLPVDYLEVTIVNMRRVAFIGD